MLVNTGARARTRAIWVVALGLCLGGLLTLLAENFLPPSAAREFMTASVSGALGPFSVDLVVLSFTIGPAAITLNVLSLLGIAVVGFFSRSLL